VGHRLRAKDPLIWGKIEHPWYQTVVGERRELEDPDEKLLYQERVDAHNENVLDRLVQGKVELNSTPNIARAPAERLAYGDVLETVARLPDLDKRRQWGRVRKGRSPLTFVMLNWARSTPGKGTL